MEQCARAQARSGDPSYRFMHSWATKFREIGLNVLFTEGQHSEDGYSVVEGENEDDTHYLALPFPDRNYAEFQTKPSIFGLRLIEHFDIDEILKDEDNLYDMDAIELVWTLSPVKMEDSLYLGISRMANKKEVLRQVSKIFDTYAKPRKNRKRTDKWKYYVIVYDLKTDENQKYSDIATQLAEAYPDLKSLFDEKNIGNYYDKAQKLIGLSRYLDHLQI
jgi:hypothetical protein